MSAGRLTLVTILLSSTACFSSHDQGQPQCEALHARGVDSSFEETINVEEWADLRNKHALDFAFVKATQGQNIVDDELSVGWEGTGKAGMLRGAYHYYIFDQEPEAQAEFFLKSVAAVEQQFGKAEMPMALDVELERNAAYFAAGADMSKTVANLRSFLSIVEKESGQRPVVYSYPAFWQEQMRNTRALDDYPLWMAYYPVAKNADDDEADNPTIFRLYEQKRAPSRALFGWPQWTFWQYFSEGYFDGVDDKNGRSARWDLNTFNGSVMDLLEFLKVPSDKHKDYCHTGLLKKL